LSTDPQFVGVDVGGTNLRVALADRDGAIVADAAEPIADLSGPGFADRVAALAASLGAVAPLAAGLGLPGPIGADGRMGPLVNAPWLSGEPVRALLEARLGVPVAVENDVNLAALAEQRHGCGRGVQDLVFIAVGTGVGMGIVAGGQVIRGGAGGAGELGLLPLAVDRVAADFSELGPLESVAGGAGLAARWAAHTAAPATGRDVFAAAERGEAAALALLAEQAEALAMGVRAVQAILDPRLVVFGGGIGARADVVARVQAVLAGHGPPVPAIVTSALGERAGVVGAVEAARSASIDPTPEEGTRVP
jgi:predicted NBD/HSP70 family sugar kinase